MQRWLFLLGGSEDTFHAVADQFVPLAGGEQANIALLLAGTPGWEAYVPHYTDPWTQRGVTQYHVIVPNEHGVLDIETAMSVLSNATGIFIGGGHTPTYQRLFAEEPVRQMLQERYAQGIPIAGLSAGALIMPSICAIPPEDSGDVPVNMTSGVGLLQERIVGVHFTEWNALPHMLDAMIQTQFRDGLGIDESTCVVFQNGQIVDVVGGCAYLITMKDFTTRDYTIEACHSEELPKSP